MAEATAQSTAVACLAARVAGLDWPRIEAALDADGHALTGPLLTPAECAGLAGCYEDAALFRSHIIMARHGFGRGEYKYFDHPLPDAVATLRVALYRALVPVANRWHASLTIDTRFPAEHADFAARCAASGQMKPTPLLLRYVAGDYNCLHQDLYGDLVFPLQVAFLLSEPGVDFEGGAFVMTEQRPRMQSRAHVAALRRGQGVIFAVRHKPVRGTKGVYRTTMRHGVAGITSGRRATLGIIFHDAA